MRIKARLSFVAFQTVCFSLQMLFWAQGGSQVALFGAGASAGLIFVAACDWLAEAAA